MAEKAPVAVVAANYSGRRSRVLLWDTENDTFQRGQWVKGGLDLHDVSPDGEHMAYFVTAHHKLPEAYMALSRPPYLTALAFWPAFHLHTRDATFRSDGSLDLYFGHEPDPPRYVRHPRIKEIWRTRVEPGCPFEMHFIQPRRHDEYAAFLSREANRPAVRAAVDQYGPLALEALTDAPRHVPALFPHVAGYVDRQSICTWDHRGRFVLSSGYFLMVFSGDELPGAILLDLSDQTFREAPTPDWAKTWDQPRQ